MTKKSYFMKTFNLVLNLFIFSIFGLIFTLITGYLEPNIAEVKNLLPSSQIPAYFDHLHDWLELATYLMIIGFIVLSAFEIAPRIAHDSVLNLFKSVLGTFRLRRFATQSERVDKLTTDTQGKHTVNPIYQYFNRAIRKSVLDVTDNHVRVFIKVPHSQQAQKILTEMETALKEEISGRYPDYVFSNFTRGKASLWLESNKR